MKPVGFSQWNTPCSHSHPPLRWPFHPFLRNFRYPMDVLKPRCVWSFSSGPVHKASTLVAAQWPISGFPSLTSAQGLGFHSRGGQREVQSALLKEPHSALGCWWGGMKNPHHFSCWHHWCAILHPFPINATTTQSRLSYPPTAPDWQASDSSGDEEERVWMEIERCHVWTLPKEARPILGKKKAPCFQPFLASRPRWLFEDLTDCADVFI